jgi:hypothetical protein
MPERSGQKRLVTVIAPKKPVSEMTEEELDALADHLKKETANAVLEEGRPKS